MCDSFRNFESINRNFAAEFERSKKFIRCYNVNTYVRAYVLYVPTHAYVDEAKSIFHFHIRRLTQLNNENNFRYAYLSVSLVN